MDRTVLQQLPNVLDLVDPRSAWWCDPRLQTLCVLPREGPQQHGGAIASVVMTLNHVVPVLVSPELIEQALEDLRLGFGSDEVADMLHAQICRTEVRDGRDHTHMQRNVSPVLPRRSQASVHLPLSDFPFVAAQHFHVSGLSQTAGPPFLLAPLSDRPQGHDDWPYAPESFLIESALGSTTNTDSRESEPTDVQRPRVRPTAMLALRSSTESCADCSAAFPHVPHRLCRLDPLPESQVRHLVRLAKKEANLRRVEIRSLAGQV